MSAYRLRCRPLRAARTRQLCLAAPRGSSALRSTWAWGGGRARCSWSSPVGQVVGRRTIARGRRAERPQIPDYSRFPSLRPTRAVSRDGGRRRMRGSSLGSVESTIVSALCAVFPARQPGRTRRRVSLLTGGCALRQLWPSPRRRR